MSIFSRHQNTEDLTPFETPVSVACDNEVPPSPYMYNSRMGFTLIETLVAITILIIVIIGPMTIAQKGIQNAYYAREQLVAVSLAQEAVEGIRELRDTRALEVYGGASGLTSSWIPTICRTSPCAYIPGDQDHAGRVTACSSDNSYCQLVYDPDTKTYAHGIGGGGNIYTRRITISSPVGGGVLASTSVQWTGRIFGGATRQVVLQTWIYDHYQRYED